MAAELYCTWNPHKREVCFNRLTSRWMDSHKQILVKKQILQERFLVFHEFSHLEGWTKLNQHRKGSTFQSNLITKPAINKANTANEKCSLLQSIPSPVSLVEQKNTKHLSQTIEIRSEVQETGCGVINSKCQAFESLFVFRVDLFQSGVSTVAGCSFAEARK